MFFKKKPKGMIPELEGVENIVSNALISFKTSMTREVNGMMTRAEADEYVRDHLKEIQDIMSEASLQFSRVVLMLKQRRGVIEQSEGEPYDSGRKQALDIIDRCIKRLEDAYVQVYHLVDAESPRSSSHYYTLSELANMKKQTLVVPNTTADPLAVPADLMKRLTDDYIKQYMPSEELVAMCKKTPPHVGPEVILKGICLGDYVGSAFEVTSNYEEYDPDWPYDLYRNRFTDDSVMAIAIYDAMTSIKKMEKDTVQEEKRIRHALSMFTASMRYYAKMYPLIGYGPMFYNWAVNDSWKYESWGNGGAMRSGTIGAFCNKIEDAIKYAIVSAYPTHSHKVGEQGAVATAVCVWLANHGATKPEIKKYVFDVCDDVILGPDDMIGHPEKIFDLELTPEELVSMAADHEGIHTLSGMTTLSQALINFFDSRSTITCVDNAMKYPCDSDTVAAISGGIATAYYGRVEHIDDIIKARAFKDIQSDTMAIMHKLAELE